MALRSSSSTLIALGAATLFFSAFALAEPAGKAGATRDGARPKGGLFGLMDKNGDGNIARAEARTAATELFARMDKNGDGKVMPDEQQRPQRAGHEKRGGAHFARMDKNGDGKLERSETKMPEEHFKQADANKDGKLTKEELKAAFTAKHEEHAQKRFAELDTNKDGKIDQSEVVAHADRRFTTLDTNKDGKVTREEARKGFAGMHHGKHGKRGHHGAGDCGGEGKKTSASRTKGQAI